MFLLNGKNEASEVKKKSEIRFTLVSISITLVSIRLHPFHTRLPF